MKAFYTFLLAFILIWPSMNEVSAQTAQGVLSPDEINVTAFVGDTVYAYFDVINTGTVAFYPLSSFHSDYGFFWPDDSGLPDYIQPGTSGRVIVTYTPTMPGVHTGHFTMKIGDSYPSVSMTGTAIYRGDVNMDGIVNITDVVMLIDHALNSDEPTFSTDINGDGTVTITDIVQLIDMLLSAGGGNVTPDPPVIEDEEIEVNGVTFKMIAVEGGTFSMGGNDVDNYPVHQVQLSDFHIAETEVTQALWEAVMGSNPSDHTGNTNYPVECVSWNDCQEFIAALNQLTGRNFRLPTEAEWEYAARGGKNTHGYRYSGSSSYSDVAWCENNSGDLTHIVGKKRANELGAYDMSGNVWEWCQDWYALYESASGETQVNPTGPETGTERVVRGGCMRGHSRMCDVSYRMCYTPGTWRVDVGLRLAM